MWTIFLKHPEDAKDFACAYDDCPSPVFAIGAGRDPAVLAVYDIPRKGAGVSEPAEGRSLTRPEQTCTSPGGV